MGDKPRTTIAANLADVQDRIQAACQRVARAPKEVTLVAVTKTRSLEQIMAAFECGARDFGENRIEELAAKLPQLEGQLPGVTWHMIGHLQSRKARQATLLADVIHSVDTLKLARRLERFAGEQAKTLPVLLELNVSREESKAGFAAWDQQGRDALVSQIQELAAFQHLEVQGLMTMAPIVPDPELARPIFRALRLMRDRLREQAPFSTWEALSMGMTGDFEVSIEEGATIVRVGRAIFGPRAS